MKTVTATTTIDDLDDFLAEIEAISEATGAAIQCVDADYVAGDRHLRRAVELAARAREQGTAVAREPAVEILLYAAGRRQINQALEMGVSEGKAGVVAVVSGGDEAAAEQRVRELLGATDADEGVPSGDADTIKTFFDIGDAEMAVVDGDLEAIVLERVALLDVET
ncbi:KEOPS complex component [Halonotius aquaticus]|jgi:KEOPS complex subunit Cgi121|uniref:KEOPS complex component n=1 Tax=Halonotius aquaticus TaxID=2216978 RepID=A0A3A6PLH0_9EURY|nr:KEOPS complex subunit Cgi121 [Halonotius aquaticus]RJX42299.1 KEOPS complex component [Halonotius aquaticus]